MWPWFVCTLTLAGATGRDYALFDNLSLCCSCDSNAGFFSMVGKLEMAISTCLSSPHARFMDENGRYSLCGVRRASKSYLGRMSCYKKKFLDLSNIYSWRSVPDASVILNSSFPISLSFTCSPGSDPKYMYSSGESVRVSGGGKIP